MTCGMTLGHTNESVGRAMSFFDSPDRACITTKEWRHQKGFYFLHTGTVTREEKMSLRYDEQEDEEYYDDRDMADDDVEKGKLCFPDKLYGLSEELTTLHGKYQECMLRSCSPQVVYIHGYSGVGKSALVQEFVQERERCWQRNQRKRRKERQNATSQEHATPDATNEESSNLKIPVPVQQEGPFWYSFGKFNEHMTGDPFSAFSHAMDVWISGQLMRIKRTRTSKKVRRQASPAGTQNDEVQSSSSSPSSHSKNDDDCKTECAAPSQMQQNDNDADDNDNDKDKVLKQIRCKLIAAGFNYDAFVEDGLNPSTSIVTQMIPSAKLLLLLKSKRSSKNKKKKKKKHDNNNDDDLKTSNEAIRDDINTASPNGTKTTARSDSHPDDEHGEDQSLSDGDAYNASFQIKQYDMKLISLSVATFLQSLTSICPLVLFLDDLQWADVPSLELIQGLTENRNIPNFFLLGSYRSSAALDHIVQGNDKLNGSFSEEKRDDFGNVALHDHLRELVPKDFFTSIILSNLSPDDLTEWIASTLRMDKDADNLLQLVQVIYSKTLGNAFFVKQAMEELVRRNVMYYDVMTFEWTFNLGENGENIEANKLLHDVLSTDVVQMIRSKLTGLPVPLQRALYIMAHINHSVDLSVLASCMKADFIENDLPLSSLKQYMDSAVDEGLLFHTSGSDRYRFVHDKIQEASFTSIPEGPEKDLVKLRIAHVLAGIATCNSLGGSIRGQMRSSAILDMTKNQLDDTMKTDDEDDFDEVDDDNDRMGKSFNEDFGLNNYDWMLFVAVQHFNSLPVCMIPDSLRLAKLNYQVANLCLAKASYKQAVKLLRFAVHVLEVNRENKPIVFFWKESFNFMLRLYNLWMVTEFAAGNMEQTKVAVNHVLSHATSLRDRCLAEHTRVAMTVQVNNGNYELGIIESTKLLASLGQDIPIHPTRYDILQERLKLKFALGVRPVSVLSELPMMKDDCMMKLLSQLALLANTVRNEMLNTFVTLRVMRVSLEEGISKYLSQILTTYSVPLRKSGQYDIAYSYAAIVERLLERFPKEHSSSEYATGRIILHSGVLPIKMPFANSIDVVVDNYRVALAAGCVPIAFASAMHFPLLYYASGLPLNDPLLEPKLILYENKAKQLSQETYVVIFQASRQFLYNLLGKPSTYKKEAELRGEVMDETKVLDRLEGNVLKMSLRDMSIFRIALAFIFLDEETMEQMMTRLSDYPLFDLPLVREHLRLCYNGMAAMYMGRRNHNREHTDLGRKILKTLRKLDKVGSANASPLVSCLKALEQHRQASYDDAIKVCNKYKLVQLEAIMNEHCAMLLLFETKTNKTTTSKRTGTVTTPTKTMTSSSSSSSNDISRLGQEYMGKALSLYSHWGAFGKVRQLRERYKFLDDITNSPRRESQFSASERNFFQP